MARKVARGSKYAVPLQRSAPLVLTPHPDQPRLEDWHRWAVAQRLPRAVDLFAGGGGLSLGLEQAGFRVVLAVDSDPAALATHNHNFPGPALNFDLSSKSQVDELIEELDGIDIDLIAGGPPCQPFSRAGRSKIRSLVEQGTRDATDDRRELWRAYLRVIDKVRPRAVLMENVPDMALSDDLRTIRLLLRQLEELGYDADLRLLDAWQYGVPQHRQRLILVALRDCGALEWPEPSQKVTVADAIRDLPRLGTTTGDRRLPYDPQDDLSEFQRNARRGMNGDKDVVWDHITRPVRNDDRKAFQMMTSGMRYSELPKRLKRYRDDIFDDKYKRLAWGELSRSITAHIAKDGYWYIHPEEARTLSVREAARIQSFPDEFRFAGTRSNAFTQIGNAVPPLLGQVVAAAILRAIERRPKVAHHGGTQWLRDVRAAARAWAKQDRHAHPWRHPGNAWKAACGVLLGGRNPRLVERFLELFPTAAAVDNRRFRAERGALRPHAARAVARLRAASSEWECASPDEQVRLLRPKAAERVQLSVLVARDDAILATSAALRIASRLAGTAAESGHTRSDHRITLGRLIGSGDHVAELSAALHAVGQDVCVSDQPRCSACPLSAHCATASRGVRKPVTA